MLNFKTTLAAVALFAAFTATPQASHAHAMVAPDGYVMVGHASKFIMPDAWNRMFEPMKDKKGHIMGYMYTRGNHPIILADADFLYMYNDEYVMMINGHMVPVAKEYLVLPGGHLMAAPDFGTKWE